MTFTQAVQRLAQPDGEFLAAFDGLIKHVSSATDEDLAALARVLAASGRQFPMRSLSADVASTGGPSSLTTLLCPLFLRLRGYVVPKVGVPGRPAGGVDVMATIPGFQVELAASQFERILNEDGISHVLAGSDLAPLDGALFAYRKKVGAVSVAELAIASLLSKKLAVGVNRVVLEVRVWSGGNLGTTPDDARINATRFCRVASHLGISASCVLTDGTVPFQPYIGRGEALLALHDVFEDVAGVWLMEHVDLCWRMAEGVADQARPGHANLRRLFVRHLESQGANWDVFVERVRSVKAQPVSVVYADTDGYAIVNLEALRALLVSAQDEADGGRFPDPAGVTLLVRSSTFVKAGTPIARVRHTGADPTEGGKAIFRMATCRPPTPLLPHTITE